MSIEPLNKKMFMLQRSNDSFGESFGQKLEYIHHKPVRAGLCEIPEDYHYLSARFYIDGTNDFGMLKHFVG